MKALISPQIPLVFAIERVKRDGDFGSALCDPREDGSLCII